MAGLDGSLLTYALNATVKGGNVTYDSSMTREIDTVAHDLGPATALKLKIGAKDTYFFDVDQLATGNVIVSWTQQPARWQDTKSYYQIYDSAGKVVMAKTEITLGAQITALADGGFCATSTGFRNGSDESFVQIFAADGTASGGAIRLNAGLAGTQSALGITDLGASRFWALWSDRQGSGPQTVMGRVLDTVGVAQGKAFVITRSPADEFMREIDSVELANGDVAVTWLVGHGQRERTDSIHARIFHADGRAAGDAFILAAETITVTGLGGPIGPLKSLSTVALTDGRWMVGWVDGGHDLPTGISPSQAFARIYNADGTADTDTFALAPDVQHVTAVQLEDMADGRVAARYETNAFGNTPAAFVQMLDPRLAAVALTGSDAGDELQGTGLADTIDGGNGRDKLAGMAGDDVLTGGAQADILMGGDGKDSLLGGADMDVLQGGRGDDVLTGGFGNDVLTGGLGRDSFVFGINAGQDRVTDFTLGQDVLDLRAYRFADADTALTHVTQGAEGALFVLGGHSVLLVGVDAAALGAGALLL